MMNNKGLDHVLLLHARFASHVLSNWPNSQSKYLLQLLGSGWQPLGNPRQILSWGLPSVVGSVGFSPAVVAVGLKVVLK